jgi:hypothetical protein
VCVCVAQNVNDVSGQWNTPVSGHEDLPIHGHEPVIRSITIIGARAGRTPQVAYAVAR